VLDSLNLGCIRTYTDKELRTYAAQAALVTIFIANNAEEAKVKEYLSATVPNDPNKITKLVKDIEKLPKKERWFISSEEIQNFPEILKLWHSYFELKGLLPN